MRNFEVVPHVLRNFFYRFLPYPRFPLPGDPTSYIICVNDQPRIQFCGGTNSRKKKWKKNHIFILFFQITLHLILKLWPASMKNLPMLPDLPQVLLDPHHFKNVTKIRYLLLLKINCSWSCFFLKNVGFFLSKKTANILECIDHKLNYINYDPNEGKVKQTFLWNFSNF